MGPLIHHTRQLSSRDPGECPYGAWLSPRQSPIQPWGVKVSKFFLLFEDNMMTLEPSERREGGFPVVANLGGNNQTLSTAHSRGLGHSSALIITNSRIITAYMAPAELRNVDNFSDSVKRLQPKKGWSGALTYEV